MNLSALTTIKLLLEMLWIFIVLQYLNGNLLLIFIGLLVLELLSTANWSIGAGVRLLQI
jgi:hypothetical protein